MTHTIIMPDLGQTTGEAKLLRWLKKPGDRVQKGEHLLEVETDKVTMEVEAYTTGYLREILVDEGNLACALAPIGIVTDDPNEPYRHPSPKAESSQTKPMPSSDATRRTAKVLAAPAARSLARELGIDLSTVTATGPGGLITRKDVELATATRAASKPRAAMAALVTRSIETIPHFYLTADVDVAAAERWRQQWIEAHPDLPSTFDDIFVRAASRALRDVPQLNVSYQGGRYEQRAAADVGLVVAFESGLALVPLADPGSLPWEDMLRDIRKALEKAKVGRIAVPSSRANPLVAISNLGMFGAKQFAAIIPPSYTAILAVGAVRTDAVISEQSVRAGRVATLTLSADHRVVDGIGAAKFMEKIQEHLNTL